MTRITAIAAAALVVALIGAGLGYVFVAGRDADRFADCRAGQVAGGEIGGPFTLVDAQGQTVTDKEVITEPSLVYFGYTFCPDVCPLDNVRNAQAVDLLAERGYAATPVFISIDPARDTPPVVGDFARNIHEKMIGLTGSAEQVKAASTAYKTYYQAQGDGSDPYYMVDHSTFTYLVLPGYGFVDFFRRDASPEDMAGRTACFIDAS